MMETALTSLESRALELLSSGIEAVAVASALGISESRISQLIAEPVFAAQLAEARFEALRKHNATDNEYDRLEKSLIEQLKRVIPLATKPMEITRILQIINAAKRRGASAPDSITRVKQVVRLSIPIAVINKFQVNAANQVVEAGVEGDTQQLVTIQSGSITRLLNEQAKSVSRLPAPTTEADGVVWRKRQGREQNLLEELGFTVEISNEQSSEQRAVNSASQ